MVFLFFIHMWPNKKQWNNWSLPSKLTAIGTFVSLLSIVFSVAVFIIQESDNKSSASSDKKIESQEINNFSIRKYNYLGDDFSCKTGDVCREINTSLPFMALPKKSATVYKSPELKSGNYSPIRLRNYWPIYVFNKKDFSFGTMHEGWYQIGVTTQNPIGWIRTKDIIDWKQRIILNFVFDKNNKTYPLLIFDSVYALEKSLEYSDIKQKTYNDNGEIHQINLPYSVADFWSKDTKSFGENLYIIPILDFKIFRSSSGIFGTCLKIMPDALIDKTTKSHITDPNQPVWIFDKDLHNLSRPIIEVRILLRRKELDEIRQAAAIILQQASAASLSPAGFINALRSVVAQASYTSDIDLSKAYMSNRDVSLLIDKLAYKSYTAALDDEIFTQFSQSQQEEVFTTIQRKMSLYDELLKNSNIWKPLNEDDPSEEYVYALPLDLLI